MGSKCSTEIPVHRNLVKVSMYWMLWGALILLTSSCGGLRSASKNADKASTGAEVASGKEMASFSDAAIVEAQMRFLASDELKGRDTGSDGIEAAALFLEEQLAEYGIQPYFTSYRDTLANSKEVAYNIVGYLEGSDPELKNEFIVIGAHYDHIGIVALKNGDGIANGANDNASGTITILELARYFGSHKPPARSLVFAFFSAEERGLLGSRHLASKLNAQGMDLYTMLNFEMTGVPMNGRKYLTYITGYQRSNLAEVINAYGGEDLVGYLPAAKEYNLFQRSDNYAFYQEFGVPSHTFSTFDFENYPYYHQPGDEASRMDFQHMSSLVNRMLPAIQGVANETEQRISAK